jgi:hypothetical protein
LAPAVVLAFAGSLTAAHVDARASIRCGNRLVSVGDSVIELRARCGEPDDVQRFSDIRVLFDGRGGRRERLIEIEEWVYLLGTGRIPRLVRLENGRVRAIETAAFTALPRESEAAVERCRRQLFPLNGTTAAQVRLTCGPPDQLDRIQDELTTRTKRGLEFRRLVTRERWVYNFGSAHLLRIFEFANGRLVSMDTGDRGFDAD